MGVVVTVVVVLVAWSVCALVVGVVLGRAMALRPRGDAHSAPPAPETPRGQTAAPLSVSYRERS
ncbi:hypothetical protein [Nocardioides sp. CER19]|uniref:hypothetical protein n=1 Tax=Nocardioides sp. CER19 TaxID=3038538 RepID=UPI00244B2515|nr:hypothetical protein [Nocardioides sp. CER19]MDH2413352.1 hypothetical protein [Nocardioides sp. CER19]